MNRDPGRDTSLQDPTVRGEGGERETEPWHRSPDPRHRAPPPQWATHRTPCSCSTSYFYIKSLLSFLQLKQLASTQFMAPEVCAVGRVQTLSEP